jgi:hypothetical protein
MSSEALISRAEDETSGGNSQRMIITYGGVPTIEVIALRD